MGYAVLTPASGLPKKLHKPFHPPTRACYHCLAYDHLVNACRDPSVVVVVVVAATWSGAARRCGGP